MPSFDPGTFRRAQRAAVVCAALLVTSAPSAARGQPMAERVATAQALYEDAAALMRTGDYADACPKLEESQRLDPAMGTQFFLAVCYAETNRPTSAWSLFLEVALAARAAGSVVRENTARARAAALEPKLPRLTIHVSAQTASLSGLTVTRDTTVLKPVVWGTAVPVDLGSHVVRVSATGKVVWEATVRVDQLGQKVEVRVPSLDAADGGPRAGTRLAGGSPSGAPQVGAPLAGAGPEAGPPTAGTAASPEASPGLPGPRRAAIAVGSVGLGGAAAGAVLGVLAAAAWKKADEACPSHLACSAQAHDDSKRALSLATGSTIAFAAGGALVAGGIILWFTAPKKHHGLASPGAVWIAPVAAPGFAGASAGGAF